MVPKANDCCPYKRQTRGHRQRGSHVKAEAEVGVRRPQGPPEATGAGRGRKSPPVEPPEGARPWPHRDLDVWPPVCCFQPPVCGAFPAAPGHPCTWTPLYFRDQPWQHLEEGQEGSRQEAEVMPWGQWDGPGLGPALGTEVGVMTRKRG